MTLPSANTGRPRFKDKALGHLGKRFFIEAQPGSSGALSFLGRLISIEFIKIDDKQVEIKFVAKASRVKTHTGRTGNTTFPTGWEDEEIPREFSIIVTNSIELNMSVTGKNKEGEDVKVTQQLNIYNLENEVNGTNKYNIHFLD